MTIVELNNNYLAAFLYSLFSHAFPKSCETCTLLHVHNSTQPYKPSYSLTPPCTNPIQNEKEKNKA